jgi:hypothetical protein
LLTQTSILLWIHDGIFTRAGWILISQLTKYV